MKTLTEKERWEIPEHRKLIVDAIEASIKRNEHIPFLLWSVEGTPWEEYTTQKVAENRIKFFIENVPRFA